MSSQPLDWVNTAIAALGLVGGGIGFLRAQSSNTKARKAQAAAGDAQADATAALKKNSEATERIATALEAMARIGAPGSRGQIETRGGATPQYTAGGREEARLSRAGWYQVMDALAAPPTVTWTLERRTAAPDTYRLRNNGDSEARGVRVEGFPDQVKDLATIRGGGGSALDDIVAGSSVIVGISNRLTLTVREIKVSWTSNDDVKQQAVLELPE